MAALTPIRRPMALVAGVLVLSALAGALIESARAASNQTAITTCDTPVDCRTSLGLTTAATCTLGTAASNCVQLNGSAQLPAVSGALLTNLPSSGTFDWAASSSYVPEAADWTNHNDAAFGGQDAAVTFTEVESGKLIRIVPDDGAENDGQGICRTIGAGNFRVGARLGLSVKGIDWDATASYCDFHLVFVDGTDLNPAGGGSDFFGAGIMVSNDTADSTTYNTITAADWDTDVPTTADDHYAVGLVVDVVLERTGTDLVTYMTREPEGGFYQLSTFTVTAGAGLICFRINQQSAAPHAWRGFVHAYAHSLASVPGWE